MNGIILLAFDCSNRWSSIGLWADGRPAAEFNADMGRRQASELPCATQKLLQTNGWALSDLNAAYVALTSATPISGPLPILENAENERGKWKLVVREIPAETEEGSPTYQLVASFRPKGFVIIID